MADAQVVQAKKNSSKNAAPSNEKEKTQKSVCDEAKTVPSSGKPQTASSSSDTRRKTVPNVPTPSPTQVSSEVLLILREMNTNMNKTNSKLEALNKRVDELYEDPYEEDYDDYNEQSQSQNDEAESSSVQHNADFSIENEPPAKKPRSDDPFEAIAQRFLQTEKFDSEVNESLAGFINSSFRNGIADETVAEMVREIHRPVNCDALAPTRVNKAIWGLLKSQTQSDDMKYQNIQKMIVKTAANMTKVLDKNGDFFDSESMEWTSNALALLGQSFKLINNRRKELHRQDLPPKVWPLTSSSQPYTENLYGDDVNKNVKDIQDMSRLGQSWGRGSNFRNRRRGGRRGMSRGGRGRGYRGHAESYDNSGYGYPPASNTQAKNQKHKK